MDKKRPYQPGYSFLDIERYLKGELSSAEMHAMEKAALSDPFLADAIEGYGTQSLGQSQSDLTAMREMIAGNKEEEARVIALPRKPIRWQMIAAVFILLSGTGIIFLLNQQSDKTTTLAAISTEKNNATPAPDTTAGTNTPPPIAMAPSIEKSSKKRLDNTTQPAASAPAPADMAMAPAERADSVLKLQQATAALMEHKQREALKKAEMQDMSRQSMSAPSPKYYRAEPLKGIPLQTNRPTTVGGNVYLIKGQVVNQQQLPVANAQLAVKDSTTTRVLFTDQQGQFFLPTRDSVSSLQVNIAGYAKLNAKITAGKANRIQLIPDSSGRELKEVVVSSLVSKKVTSMTGAVMQTNNTTMPGSDTIPQLTPSIGMKVLQEKIREALITSLHLKDLPLQDITVQLRFNEKGELLEIVFPDGTKEEMINLISPVLKSAKTWYIGKDRATGTRAFVLPIKRK